MTWHRIAIHSTSAEVAQTSATALIERILTACRDARVPGDFAVWQQRCTPTHYEYYLSPGASAILMPLLEGYRPAPCDVPDLRMLKQVLL